MGSLQVIPGRSSSSVPKEYPKRKINLHQLENEEVRKLCPKDKGHRRKNQLFTLLTRYLP